MVYQIERELHDELSMVGTTVIIDNKGRFWKIDSSSVITGWDSKTEQRESCFYAKKVDEYGNRYGNRKWFNTANETVNAIAGCWKKDETS